MKTIRMLIVEDDKELLAALKSLYHDIFIAKGFASPDINDATNPTDALERAREAQTKPYDFVSLDVNLGEADITGLNVLRAFKRFKSAWMVALLTGVEAEGRKQLRRDAYNTEFPAERLIVVEKPSLEESDDARSKLLSNRLQDIASVYEVVSRQRYIFRPIDVVSLQRRPADVAARQRRQRRFIEAASTHWQIRFNCGDLRTLPDRTWFKTLHHLLAMNPDETLTPEASLVIEPAKETEKGAEAPVISASDPVGEFFRAQGINWDELDKQGQDDLIRAALAHRLKRYVDLRNYEEEDDLAPTEEDELNLIKQEFGPLAKLAEAAFQRLADTKETTGMHEAQVEHHSASAGARAQDNLRSGDANYTREQGRWGEDSPAAQLFRARKKRACDYLRENGFADFAEHIEVCVKSTGANWSYDPPSGTEWTV
jgi:CheY-like chemotaxis protein